MPYQQWLEKLIEEKKKRCIELATSLEVEIKAYKDMLSPEVVTPNIRPAGIVTSERLMAELIHSQNYLQGLYEAYSMLGVNK